MIIDTHTHITKRPDSKFSQSFEDNVRLLIDEMKETGIQTSLVIAWAGNYNNERPSTSQLLELIKEQASLKIVAGLDMINLQPSDIEELEGYMRGKKVIGVKLYTGYQHFYPSDERCLQVYNLCIKYNMPVIFHSGDTLAGVVPNPKLKYSHPMNIDEVAADLPDLKIVIAHMGNPWLTDCAEVLYKNPNVYADISGLVVGEDLETPYGNMMRNKIRDLINYVGKDHKLMYGTDWPLAPMSIYVKFSESLGLKGEQAEELFYKNAQKVFGV